MTAIVRTEDMVTIELRLPLASGKWRAVRGARTVLALDAVPVLAELELPASKAAKQIQLWFACRAPFRIVGLQARQGRRILESLDQETLTGYGVRDPIGGIQIDTPEATLSLSLAKARPERPVVIRAWVAAMSDVRRNATDSLERMAPPVDLSRLDRQFTNLDRRAEDRSALDRRYLEAALKRHEARLQELLFTNTSAPPSAAAPSASAEAATAFELQEARRQLRDLAETLGCGGLPHGAVLAQARRLREEATAMRTAVDSFAHSTSWKITRPLRVASRFLRTGRLRAPRAAAGRAPPSDDPAPQRQWRTAQGEVRLIAFHLPQFHPIRENDAWWGEGFTEWTNTRRGKPRYRGHYQPHEPADLGFYDLRDRAALRRQTELAREAGLYGFCFYFYWFGGKRLLETPIELFAQDAEIDFPFCLCWANENWSRRWDGKDQEVLIAQTHSAEDDIGFIAHIARYFARPNYIRVGGCPVLVVYRPDLLPEPRETVERWRDWCRRNGVGEIHLAYTQGFEKIDPATYGFDTAIEFPPNNTDPPAITEQMQDIDPDFAGIVYDYRAYPARSEHYVKPTYRLWRGVFPSWDNEARRPGRGTSFHHASPALYRRWLTNAGRDTVQRFDTPDDRLLFVNAWNEWAEGAHLEPDARYGKAWIEATRKGLNDVAGRCVSKGHLVLVCHDAERHGAQMLALALARSLVEDFRYRLEIVLLGDGPLKSDFAKYGDVHDLFGEAANGDRAVALARTLKASGATAALCNTTVAGAFLETLSRAGLRTVALVHEMRRLIAQAGLGSAAQSLAAHADVAVFASSIVADSFVRAATPLKGEVIIRAQGLYKRNRYRTVAERDAAAKALRNKLGLGEAARIVLGVGHGDQRKGLDLFIEAGRQVMAVDPDVVFIWVGSIDPDLAEAISAAIRSTNMPDRFLLVGFQEDTDAFYVAADVFALTSREDPYPTVVMEAFDATLPVVCFAGAGGFTELVERAGGEFAPPEDAALLARAITTFLASPSRAQTVGEAGRALLDWDYSFSRYVTDLLRYADPERLSLSAAVPNFNYAKYLPARLESIAGQSLRVDEMVVLDDASTDDSLAVIDRTLRTIDVPHRLNINTVNSGSVFRQWLVAAEMVTCDLLWIAEADDLAYPGFLEAACTAFKDPEVVISFCQSEQIDANGDIIGPDYLDYVRDVDPDRWTRPYVATGAEELRIALAVKNTIPNVSGVVFRRSALLQSLRTHIDDIAANRVAGDWALYVHMLAAGGKIAFTPSSLNRHRRHAAGVTLGPMGDRQFWEISAMQARVRSIASPPPVVLEKAERYLRALRVQFGL